MLHSTSKAELTAYDAKQQHLHVQDNVNRMQGALEHGGPTS